VKVKRLRVKFLTWEASQVFQTVMLGMLVAFSIAACSNQSQSELNTNQEQRNSKTSSSQCQSVRHDRGETKICDRPQKIVALGSTMLENLLALEVQPVAYADYFSLPFSKFDRPSQQIPYLGKKVTNRPINLGSSDRPSLETIAKLKPDLIIGTVEENSDKYDLLSQIAPTLLFNYAKDDEWQQQIQIIANVLGRSDRAKGVIANNSKRLAETKKALQPVVNKHPKLLVLGSDRLEQNLQIDPYNHDSNCSGLLEKIGFELVFPPNSEKQESKGGQVSLEILPQLDADSIVVQGWNSDFSNLEDDLVNRQLQNVKQEWNSNAIAQSLTASKEDRVYFTSAYLCRAIPGPIGTEIFLNQLRQQLLQKS
jgi:iron complex transport system substrate-binding protein